MSEPRFKPGDFVVSKAQMEAIRLWSRPDSISLLQRAQPILYQVVQVHRIACYSNEQTSYECRAAGLAGVDAKAIVFVEIELDPAPTEPTTERTRA